MADELELDVRPGPAEAAPARNLRVELAGDIRAAEAKYGLPDGLLARMINTESNWNPEAVSPKGAVGILQFMPDTAAGLKIDPRDPKQSIDGAGRMLARLNRQYGGDWPKTLAAYNWGEGNVARLGMEKMPLETRNYLTKNIPDMGHGIKMPPADELDVKEGSADGEPELDVQADRDTLDARMQRRAELEKQDAALRTQELQLTRQSKLGNLPGASPETKRRSELAAQALDQIQQARAELARQMDATGVGSTGRTVGGIAGGILGGIGGGAIGAPTGPLAAGSMVAGSALGTAAGSALGTKIDIELARRKAQDITPEEAWKLIGSNALEDAVWDTAGSLLFLGGNKIYRLSGDRNMLRGLRQQLLDKATGKRAALSDAKAGAAAKELFDPASLRPAETVRQEVEDAANTTLAVRELTKRTGGATPTPGQVTGQAGTVETSARATHPEIFAESQKALETATEGFRRDVLAPRGQPSATQIGTTVTDMLDAVKKKVQGDTAPAFDAAASTGFAVDMRSYILQLNALLQAHKRSNGTLLKSSEAAWLEDQLARFSMRQPTMDARGVVDMLSGLKRKMREMTVEGAPSTEFKKTLGAAVKNADAAYEKAARATGNQKVYDDLIQARDAYSDMMGKVFDDEMSAAMKRSPEDVGKLIWQRGHVSGPAQLQEVQKLALANKTMTQQEVDQMNESILRGYLAQAVPDAKAAANWSQSLASDPAKRETFEALAKGPGGTQLRQLMAVLEQAAKVTARGTGKEDFARGAPGGVTQRVAHGNLGLGYATGFISLPLVGLGMSLTGISRMMAKLYTTADKGLYRDFLLVLKAGTDVSNKAARGPVRAAAGRLAQWASENGIDLFQSNPEVQVEEQQ